MRIKYSLIDKAEDDEMYIYWSKSYQEIFSRIYKSVNKYIKIEKNNKVAFIPIIIRKLDLNNFEAFSPYGYGGIFGQDIHLSDKDIKILKEYLSENRIHSLFIRHSPFSDNYLSWPKEITEANRITYLSRLENHFNFDSYKKTLKQKIRASINYAQKNGFYCESIDNPIEDGSLKDFYKLYLTRMIEIRSQSFYHFDYKFFEDHFINFYCKCKLIVIKNEFREIVSGALFLCDYPKKIVHYHLSGSSREALKNQCNELMISYVNFHFGKLGYEIMNLGGGLKFDESDGLSRFKKKFSNYKKTFYITKLVCDSKTYLETRKSFLLKDNFMFLIGDAMK